MMRLVLGFLLAGFLLVPTASAHLTVKATPPQGPIPWDAPTSVDVEFSASCATVLTEYEVESRSPLTIVLNPGAPFWITGAGDKVPFKVDMCGADGSVRSKGKIALTPGPLAPGLEEVKIPVGARNAQGAAEVGEALVPIRIAYRGMLDITTPPDSQIRLENGTATGELVFNASINADSMVMIEALESPQHGELQLGTSVDIASPLAENRTYRHVPLAFTYQANQGANVTMDMVTLRIIMHATSDAGAATEAQDIVLHFMASDHQGRPDEHGHSHADGTIASPPIGLVATAFLAAGWAMTRRARKA